MKFTEILATIGFASMANAYSGASITTSGITTTCGQQTCCLPDCKVSWSDDHGCNGNADFGGACSGIWYSQYETNDHSADICGSARVVACGYGDHKLMFVVNGNNELSAHVFPKHYDECQQTGQCPRCHDQGSCTERPYFVGYVTPGQVTCSDLTGHWSTFVARAGGDAAYQGC